jgi:cellulose synthase/poly-beta-1,6-N-acetylglucosamine synthase-like glycosyltransferase
MAKLLFWISAGFAFYVYLGYPLLLWALQAVSRPSPSPQRFEPSVSLLVAAYNEAAVIADKIRNSLAIDYPADKLEVVIASDGSTARFCRKPDRGANSTSRLSGESRQDCAAKRSDTRIARGDRCFFRRLQHAGS